MSESELAVRDTGPPAPIWERRYPGRLQWEIDWLKYFGANPRVDGEALKRGTLRLDLEWTIGGQKIELQADFPDSYPHLRPQVRLRNGAPLYQRHIGPSDGTVCLIGRDARQWTPDLGLARLLDAQLEDALSGAGEEDPQAEPNEHWWNCCTSPEIFSFILVDSGWDLSGHAGGFLEVEYVATRKPMTFRGVVRRVLDSEKREIATWTGMVPDELRNAATIRIQWARTHEPLVPLPTWPDLQKLLLSKEGPFNQGQRAGTKLANGLLVSLYAIVHPTELTLGHIGEGWVFPLVTPADKKIQIVPVFRAGPNDIGERVPAVQHLRDKVVGMVGLGAVGGPAAVELARNGCRHLKLLEPDRVEPGNSIRWPLGTSAWGRRKIVALQEFIGREYGWCHVETFPDTLGDVTAAGSEEERLCQFLDGVDIVVDGTANFGVTTLLGEYCRARDLPLITLWATPPVTGGVVALFYPGSGCPMCLEHGHHEGTIEKPLGYGDEGAMHQPTACAERTFTGSSTDLQELSLEAVRLAVSCLAGESPASVVETLALADHAGKRVPPQWRVDDLSMHRACTCGQ